MSKKIRLGDWHEEVTGTAKPLALSELLLKPLEETNGINEEMIISSNETAPDPPFWSRLVRSHYSRMHQQELSTDINWWCNIGKNGFLKDIRHIEVSKCIRVNGELLQLDSVDGIHIWLNTHWIQGQYKLGRPLRLIHNSFHGIKSEEAIADHLIDLLNTVGCQILLFDPLVLGNGRHFISQRFMIRF